MIRTELKKLENTSFAIANDLITGICTSREKLSLEEIEFVLNLKEKELVNSFFYKYELFDKSDFIFIEHFINSNLENENKDFVSDLIYIGLDFGLDLNYSIILSFLIMKDEDKDLLVLACLEYLHKNIKFIYYKELVKNLEYVRNNIHFYQNEQLLASLILFRITHKTNYLSFVKELINAEDSNFKFLKNILKGEMYDADLFDRGLIDKILNK